MATAPFFKPQLLGNCIQCLFVACPAGSAPPFCPVYTVKPSDAIDSVASVQSVTPDRLRAYNSIKIMRASRRARKSKWSALVPCLHPSPKAMPHSERSPGHLRSLLPLRINNSHEVTPNSTTLFQFIELLIRPSLDSSLDSTAALTDIVRTYLVINLDDSNSNNLHKVGPCRQYYILVDLQVSNVGVKFPYSRKSRGCTTLYF